MILNKCPHCNASHVQAEDRLTEVFNPQRGPAKNTWTLVRCQNPRCRKLILVIESAEVSAFIYPPATFELDNKIFTNNEIIEDFREAGLCLSTGCYKASAVMSRRVLQRCLKEQGCNQHNLIDQIDHAIKLDILRKPLHKIATEIRKYGNLGAHPDDNQLTEIDKDIASHILKFVELILDEFYQIPAMAQELEKNRLTPPASNIS